MSKMADKGKKGGRAAFQTGSNFYEPAQKLEGYRGISLYSCVFLVVRHDFIPVHVMQRYRTRTSSALIDTNIFCFSCLRVKFSSENPGFEDILS